MQKAAIAHGFYAATKREVSRLSRRFALVTWQGCSLHPAEEHVNGRTPLVGHSSPKFPSGSVSLDANARVTLDCAGFDGFGKGPTDHTRCDDGVMPLICPTCQMVS